MNIMKHMKNGTALVLGLAMTLAACKKEDPVPPAPGGNNPPPNEQELITTVIMHFESMDGSENKLFTWRDLDGDGGDPPVIEVDNVEYVFVTWRVDGQIAGGNPITLTMDGPHTATAHYEAGVAQDGYFQYMYRLGSGTQGLTISGGGAWYTGGSQASPPAAPASMVLGGVTYTFQNWYVNGVIDFENPITVVINGPTMAVALYEP